MSVACPDILFQKFKASLGSSFDAFRDESAKEFLYEALSEDLNYADFLYLPIPKLEQTHFQDWDLFEDWCHDIRPGLLGKLVEQSDSEATKAASPVEYFKNWDNLLEKILEVSAVEPSAMVSYVRITSGSEMLYLIYLDADSWSLGWGDSVLVLNDINELASTPDFY
jgi:hypothetical protein